MFQWAQSLRKPFGSLRAVGVTVSPLGSRMKPEASPKPARLHIGVLRGRTGSDLRGGAECLAQWRSRKRAHLFTSYVNQARTDI